MLYFESQKTSLTLAQLPKFVSSWRLFHAQSGLVLSLKELKELKELILAKCTARCPRLMHWLTALQVKQACLSLIALRKILLDRYTRTMKIQHSAVLICRALILGSLMAMLSACATAQPRDATNVCSIFKEKRGWHKAAVNAQKKWGTSMHIPMAFMYQESTFRAKAKPPRRELLGFIPWRRLSSAYGYAQALDGTWQEYLRSTGEYWRVRHDFADATDFIHWYILRAARINGVSTSDAYRLYLNYHEGLSGFRRKTYARKPWLLNTANNVQLRSQTFREQYRQCAHSLKPGFFGRLIGW